MVSTNSRKGTGTGATAKAFPSSTPVLHIKKKHYLLRNLKRKLVCRRSRFRVRYVSLRDTVRTLHHHQRKKTFCLFYLSLVSCHSLQEQGQIKGREIRITMGQAVQTTCTLFLSCCCINMGSHGNIFAIFYRL